jgi:aspartokinase-like uncharacterized kinase
MVQMRNPPKGQEAPALVVKIGGSLYRSVPDLIRILRSPERRLLIVPGGGPFADAVRQAGIDGEAAHWMAIAAMEQYGWLLASQGMKTTDQLAIPETTTVFLPYRCLRAEDPLPHSWDVTSDSIAAWVAGALGLDLLLLKSVEGITVNGILQERVNAPLECDVVDPFFIPFVLKEKVRSIIINGSYPGRVEKYLMGKPVPGTAIGTTF